MYCIECFIEPGRVGKRNRFWLPPALEGMHTSATWVKNGMWKRLGNVSCDNFFSYDDDAGDFLQTIWDTPINQKTKKNCCNHTVGDVVGNKQGTCDWGELNTLNVTHTDVDTLGAAAAEDSDSSESDEVYGCCVKGRGACLWPMPMSLLPMCPAAEDRRYQLQCRRCQCRGATTSPSTRCPRYPRLIFTMSYDKLSIFWNIMIGEILRTLVYCELRTACQCQEKKCREGKALVVIVGLESLL